MTAGTPMTGRDTGAAYKGLIIGFVSILAVVLIIVTLTNRKFASHEGGAPAAAESH